MKNTRSKIKGASGSLTKKEDAERFLNTTTSSLENTKYAVHSATREDGKKSPYIQWQFQKIEEALEKIAIYLENS